MHASYPKKSMIWMPVLYALCYKLIRMSQPQSSNLWPRLISHLQQSDAYLYDTRDEFDRLLKENFASLAEIRSIVCWWILCENFPWRCPEERIPSADWTSYLRRRLREEFVCELRYFCKRCFLEMIFRLIANLWRTKTHRELVQLTPNLHTGSENNVHKIIWD